LCIYDNPSTTHFKVGPALVGRAQPHSRCRRAQDLRARRATGYRAPRRAAGRLARGLPDRLQRRLERRRRDCWPALMPGTASSPACSRRSAWAWSAPPAAGTRR
jgi:hypothetical protein